MNSVQATRASIRVMNSTGSLVEERTVNVASGSNVWSIDSQAWAAGLYTIQVVTSEGIESLPIMKQ
jgi:hypothetical protein